MIYQPDIKLARNFTLREVCEWARNLQMSDSDRDKAVEMAINELTPEVLVNATIQAQRLQKLRDRLNQLNPGFTTRIHVTSWFRPMEWELYRDRDGSSQHTKGWATDFTITGLPEHLRSHAMKFAVDWLAKYESSYSHGFTKDYETFIHNDARGVK